MNESYWIIDYNPDLFSLGQMQSKIYLKVFWIGLDADRKYEKEIIKDWCQKEFGPKIVFINNINPVKSWKLKSSNKVTFDYFKVEYYNNFPKITVQKTLALGESEIIDLCTKYA